MSEPVNLNRFRKQKAREIAKSRANENAFKFGRTKAEKQRDQAENRLQTQKLDGHKRDDQP